MKLLLILLVGGFWMTLVAYVLWYFFKAKTVQPLTIDDLALTWKVHKQRDGCNASRIHSLIKKNDEVVGFRCECGYKFIQKRLITQSPQEQHVSASTIQKQIQKQLPNTWKQALWGISQRSPHEFLWLSSFEQITSMHVHAILYFFNVVNWLFLVSELYSFMYSWILNLSTTIFEVCSGFGCEIRHFINGSFNQDRK